MNRPSSDSIKYNLSNPHTHLTSHPACAMIHFASSSIQKFFNRISVRPGNSAAPQSGPFWFLRVLFYRNPSLYYIHLGSWRHPYCHGDINSSFCFTAFETRKPFLPPAEHPVFSQAFTSVTCSCHSGFSFLSISLPKSSTRIQHLCF